LAGLANVSTARGLKVSHAALADRQLAVRGLRNVSETNVGHHKAVINDGDVPLGTRRTVYHRIILCKRRVGLSRRNLSLVLRRASHDRLLRVCCDQRVLQKAREEDEQRR
jgi:hypothetical protein